MKVTLHRGVTAAPTGRNDLPRATVCGGRNTVRTMNWTAMTIVSSSSGQDHGPNLYAYVRKMVTAAVDPTGLVCHYAGFCHLSSASGVFGNKAGACVYTCRYVLTKGTVDSSGAPCKRTLTTTLSIPRPAPVSRIDRICPCPPSFGRTTKI